MLRDSKSPPQKPSRLAVAFARAVSLLLGKFLFRLKFHNISNIPAENGEGLIIVANHQTYLDPFFICAPIRRNLRFMAWDEAFRWRISGIALRALGAFPVSLKRGGTLRAMLTSIEVLNDGGTLMIFPEGSREFSSGDLLPFKTGAARLAIEAKVPVLPVTIRGGNRVWSQDHKFPRLGKIEIFYHPVYYPEPGSSGQDQAKKITEILRKIIASA
ncbi:MAG: 1-acyl-sn-glycerol-3-phosphate acyltransferase [Acidobacteria bacterium]|nr:1-acyl-sn-glycerol-3-phosphate acyltransferase [Acidobacteriota bacterium]